MSERLRIKQIIPVPEGFTVLSKVMEDDSREAIIDLTKEGWSYFVALVDGGQWEDDYVALYETEPSGWGQIASKDVWIVPKRNCSKCGQEMTPHLDFKLKIPLWYSCGCSLDR